MVARHSVPQTVVNTVGYDNNGPAQPNAMRRRRSSSARVVYPSESGQQGDAGIPGGQVTVSWNDYGANQNRLMANSISPGQAYQFTNNTGGIIDAGTMTGPTATFFPQTVSLPAGQILNLNSLNVNLAITDSTDATLGLILRSPSTTVNGVTVKPFITLFAASTINVGGTQTTLNPDIRGITGTNVGVVTTGSAVGTTFTDNASRSITDINPSTALEGHTGPYIGNYRIENDGFVTRPVWT